MHLLFEPCSHHRDQSAPPNFDDFNIPALRPKYVRTWRFFCPLRHFAGFRPLGQVNLKNWHILAELTAVNFLLIRVIVDSCQLSNPAVCGR